MRAVGGVYFEPQVSSLGNSACGKTVHRDGEMLEEKQV